MKPVDDIGAAIHRAIQRVATNRRTRSHEPPLFVAWRRRDGSATVIACTDPERAARITPAQFAEWLRTRAPKAHWAFWKLLPPRFRPPKPDPLQVYELPANKGQESEAPLQ